MLFFNDVSLVFGFAVALMVGQSVHLPVVVWQVLRGGEIAGAGFTIRTLRLPRAVLAILAGAAFGMGGAAFQTLLRNPLASPDIIGITAGASASAVFLHRGAVGHRAGGFGLCRRGGAWRRAADLPSVLARRGQRRPADPCRHRPCRHAAKPDAYVLSRAPAWSLQEALRWLSGSVNGAQLNQALPLGLTLALCGGILLWRARDLEAMRMGDEAAAALGVRLGFTRVSVILAGVGLVAVATASAGPVAFVAFLSGPIAARLTGRDGPVLLPAAGVGAALVLVCDFVGQVLMPARYPVGIVTGILGAPYLVFLILRENRKGTGA